VGREKDPAQKITSPQVRKTGSTSYSEKERWLRGHDGTAEIGTELKHSINAEVADKIKKPSNQKKKSTKTKTSVRPI